MQLGARWAAGAPPHRGVPAALHAAIAAQEERHPGAGSWTLTWLEGRPRCALDDAVVVALGADGAVRVTPGPGGAGAADAHPSPEAPGAGTVPDDEDDWLS